MELKAADNRQSKDEIREQVLGYMDACGSKEGWLVTFDRDAKRSWTEKIKWETETRIVHWIGC